MATTTYIDIDCKRRTINGEPATEREIIVTANQIYGQPARFFCLYRNDLTGQYRYADFEQQKGQGGNDGTQG